MAEKEPKPKIIAGPRGAAGPRGRDAVPAPRRPKFNLLPEPLVKSEASATFLYNEDGLPLRPSGKTFIISTSNPIPSPIVIPQNISVGDELTFSLDGLDSTWKVLRLIHVIGVNRLTRHLWLMERKTQ